MSKMRVIFGLQAVFMIGGAAFGQGLSGGKPVSAFGDTQLVALSFDGVNSGMVRTAAQQSFDLSGGENIDLKAWYSPKFPNITAIFSTQVNRDLTVMWGGSIGERGQKYRIGPAINLGFVYRARLDANQSIQFDVFGGYGGALSEGTCLGDYGALGGVQVVNCRLAASILPPEETLGYLWSSPPLASAVVQVTYRWVF